MAYRLIISVPLRTETTAREVAAHSELMPPGLAAKLAEQAPEHCAAPADMPGPVFSYRPAEVSGGIYHLLAAAYPAGGDDCCRVHLIAATQEEVQAPDAAAQPTPAGILLALEQQGLLRRMPSSGILAAPLPPLPECSPASTQAWARIAGAAEQAHILLTEPYRRGGILAVPPGTASADALALLHESQVQAPTWGWGIPFCTATAPDALPDAQSYAITTIGSPLHLRALSAGVPVLTLSPAGAPPREQRSPTHLQPRPYFYGECIDDNVFAPSWCAELRPPSTRA